MPEVLLGDLDRHAVGDRMTGVRVAQPVRAGFGQPSSALFVATGTQLLGALRKERFCRNKRVLVSWVDEV